MEQIVKQRVLPTQPIVAPERLNTQQVHGQDLADNALVCGADSVGRDRLPQQTGVLQQSRMHIFERRQQGAAVGGAGQDHHHQATAQNTDNHLAYARLRYLPQFGGIDHINNRKGNDGAGIAGKLESIGDVVGIHRACPGTKRQPARHSKEK